VVPHLLAAGHRAHAVTLTGLGDRAHLMSPAITLETMISDVVNAMEAEEMTRPMLVVHSFAGMIGTAIADRMPQRLEHLVYIDAMVPLPGETWSSTHAPATREARISASEASRDYSFPPPDPSVYGLAGAQYDWVKRRQVPHPGRTYTAELSFDPVRVGSVQRTYIACTSPALATIDVSRKRVRDPAFWGAPWRVAELSTGHDPMVSEPAALAGILLRIVQST